MLYAILECTDRTCEAQYEAWGEREQLEGLACELCGSPIVALGYTEADRRRGRADVLLREVA